MRVNQYQINNRRQAISKIFEQIHIYFHFSKRSLRIYLNVLGKRNAQSVLPSAEWNTVTNSRLPMGSGTPPAPAQE